MVLIIITFLLSDCDADHYQAAQAALKDGEVYLQNPCNQLQIELLKEDSTINSFVFTTHITFPPDTTKFKFLIDSGSPTIISQKIVQKININNLFKYENTNIPYTFSIVQIPQLQLNKDVFFSNIAAVIEKFPEKSFWEKHQIMGVIGANCVEKAAWYFNWKTPQVYIFANTTYVPDLASYQSIGIIRDMWRIPKVGVFFNRFPQKQLANLHTGFVGGLKVPLAEWQRSGYLEFDSLRATLKVNEPLQQTNYWTLIQAIKPDSSYFSMAHTLKMGHLIRTKVPVVFRQGADYQLGNSFMQPYEWIFDTKYRRVWIK